MTTLRHLATSSTNSFQISIDCLKLKLLSLSLVFVYFLCFCGLARVRACGRANRYQVYGQPLVHEWVAGAGLAVAAGGCGWPRVAAGGRRRGRTHSDTQDDRSTPLTLSTARQEIMSFQFVISVDCLSQHQHVRRFQ